MRGQHIYQQQFQNEGILLATLMHDPDLLSDCQLITDHFTDSRHRGIYQAMHALQSEGVEPSYETLIQQDAETMQQMGGFGHVTKVKTAYLTSENFQYQQETILRFYATERSIQAIEEFTNGTSHSNDLKAITELIGKLENYESLSLPITAPFRSKVEKRIYEHADSPAKGISGVETGFYDMNMLLDGYQRKKLHIVAARPSVGKTAWALNSMRHGAKQNVFSTFFSLETSNGDLIDRMISAEARVGLKRVKNVNRLLAGDTEPFSAYTQASSTIAELPMDVRDDIFTIPKMRAALRENMKKHPNFDHVVYVDYLTLVKPPLEHGQRRDLEVDSIANALKSMAKDFDVPVICLSQLSRAVESRQDKRPNMADLRDSGGIEQIADMIAFLYRDDYQEQGAGASSDVEFIIRKNRDGQTSTIKFKFNKQFQQYTESSR